MKFAFTGRSRCVSASFSLAVLALAALSTGCGPTPCDPKAYNVTVEVDNSLREKGGTGHLRTVPVDVVAVSSTEKGKWDHYSMTSYFKPGDDLNESAKKRHLQFDADHPGPMTIRADDPIWQKWKGNQFLYVLAYLPTFEDKEGNEDLRRHWVPLGSCHWKDRDTIHFVIRAGGIEPVPPPAEKK